MKFKYLSLAMKVIIIISCGYGLFNAFEINIGRFRWDIFMYFTDLSNILVFITMFASAYCLVRGIKSPSALLNLSAVMITITFLIYHFLLSKGGFGLSAVIRNNSTMSLHQHYITPILTIIDWIIFAPHGKCSCLSPFKWITAPIAYFLFIIIRAKIIDEFSLYANKFPYFFIDIEKIGIYQTLINAVFFLCLFILLGYIFIGIDKLISILQREKAPQNA